MTRPRHLNPSPPTAYKRRRRDALNAAGFCRIHPTARLAPTSRTVCPQCLVGLNEPNRLRTNKRRSKYGETGVERLAAQGGKCPTCQREIRIDHRHTNIDHCHACGAVRSVMCGHCNKAEGMAGKTSDRPWETLRRLADYVEAHARECGKTPSVLPNIGLDRFISVV